MSAAEQAASLPSTSTVIHPLYNEHERSSRFQENLAKRPRDCALTESFETKWAFSVAESKRADVEKKTSHQLTSATMTISFALQEVKEEITEIDSLLRGINLREHELESMSTSLDKMCLTLASRSNDRKLSSASAGGWPNTLAPDKGGGGGATSQEIEDVAMKTANEDMMGPSSDVSTASELSIAELAQGNTVLMPEARSRSNSVFDYSALSAYTPLQRTPHKMDSTITCPRTGSKSSRSSCSRSRSARGH